MGRRRDSVLPGVAVLYNHSQRLIRGEPQDLVAEQGVIACAQAVADALQKAGHRVAQVPFCAEVEESLVPYPPAHWVVFNLGEGLEGQLFEEARIAWTLEAKGYRFTGSEGEAIARSAHKARAKSILATRGIATPPWWLFRSPDEADAATALRFPLMVKPVAEDASLGIGPKAVVHNSRQLRERVAYVVDRYHQLAIAELFVSGREFNISLWGDPPEVLALAEIDFSAFADPYERIVSFAAKWEADSFEYSHTPVLCPAPVEPALGACLSSVARQAWEAIGCRGYARIDMRVADDRTAYVVEVNCNPDLSPDAGFYRAARAAGYDYGGMVAQILELALRRKYTYDRDGNARGWSTDSATDRRSRRLQVG